MLSQEENELLTRVGPGAPMGEFMRQYWIPAILSKELPAPDGPPLRVRLLCEDLIGFRDTSGRIGLIQNSCMHRGASLFFGRNEEDGLRCVYHGWKYDVSGQCVDMPNEPPESSFKQKIKTTAYPCIERNGLIWAYLGPRTTPPPLPDLEPNMLPSGGSVNATLRSCNYLQALEGDIDTSHSPFLHFGGIRPQDTRPGTMQYYRLRSKAPRYSVVDTDFGAMYGAYMPAEVDSEYWRIACYLFPFFTITPTGILGNQVAMRCWVPIDDEHTTFITMGNRDRVTGRAVVREPTNDNGMGQGPRTTDWYGRFKTVQDKSNDYLIDRELQKGPNSFTGIHGIGAQDQAVTESMGGIFDRRREHLGTSDSMIVKTRRRLMEAIRAFTEHGVTPPGVDDPTVYHARGGQVIIPKGADWLKETEHLRKAFVDHPEIDLTVAG